MGKAFLDLCPRVQFHEKDYFVFHDGPYRKGDGSTEKGGIFQGRMRTVYGRGQECAIGDFGALSQSIAPHMVFLVRSGF